MFTVESSYFLFGVNIDWALETTDLYLGWQKSGHVGVDNDWNPLL